MPGRLLWNVLAARHVAELCVRGGRRNTHRSTGPYLTTVLRVPAIVAARICHATGELASRGEHDHFWYPAESLHVTALNLDPVADRVEDRDFLLRLADAMATCPPVPIRLTGLNVSNATIFAERGGQTTSNSS